MPHVIGLIPLQMSRESFWTTPAHLLTLNSMQGQLYDQITDKNIILIEDLKERGLHFLEQQNAESIDFRHAREQSPNLN